MSALSSDPSVVKRRRTGPVRERKKANNRAALLRAAAQVFSEMGHGAASVRDIIRRTELASGTFYNYFPDKDAIFRAVIEDAVAELRTRERELRQHATTMEAFIENYFRAYFEFIAENPERAALLRRNAGTIRTLLSGPAVLMLYEELLHDIRAAINAGILPPVSSTYLATAMSGIAFEMSLTMASREPVDAEEATSFASRLVIGGLRGLTRPL